jgi:hypothetical protein
MLPFGGTAALPKPGADAPRPQEPHAGLARRVSVIRATPRSAPRRSSAPG